MIGMGIPVECIRSSQMSQAQYNVRMFSDGSQLP